jgi:hypothetical protein
MEAGLVNPYPMKRSDAAQGSAVNLVNEQVRRPGQADAAWTA